MLSAYKKYMEKYGQLGKLLGLQKTEKISRLLTRDLKSWRGAHMQIVRKSRKAKNVRARSKK